MTLIEKAEAAATRKRRATTKKKCRTVKKRVNGRVVRKKVCTKKRKVVVRKKGPSAAAPPVTTPLSPQPVPAANPPAAADPMVYGGAFGLREAERLLWRAGFGPKPGQGAAVAALGLEAAITSLTRPSGTATLSGPEPDRKSVV